MSDNFSGFSQEEIRKVSNTKPKKSELKQHIGIRRAPTINKNKAQNANLAENRINGTKTKTTPTIADDDSVTFDNINLDESMSKSIEGALFYQPMKATTESKKHLGSEMPISNTDKKDTANDSSLLKLPTKIEDENSTLSDTVSDSSILQLKPDHTDEKVIDLNVDSPFRGISLRDFESHRKLIEEQNRHKKVLLQKAIEHHSQKTAAEAKKIEEIRTELSKLDNDLAVDVSILRKQIDNACINFANIEKNYIKIEAQFLKAKMDLHNAAEKKELLTEHLCTVIAHNEDRKAQKLSELMQKVGLTPTGEYEIDPTNNSDK